MYRYKRRDEIVFFFVLHLTIILLPFYYVTNGTFPIYNEDVYGASVMQMIYHFWFYLPVSIVTGVQLNYMTHPPKQLLKLGANYRIVPVIFTFVFSALTRKSVNVFGDV